MESEDPYAVFGVNSGASAEEILRAYVTMVKQYHSDHAGDNKDKIKKYNEHHLKIMVPMKCSSIQKHVPASHNEEIRAKKEGPIVLESKSHAERNYLEW